MTSSLERDVPIHLFEGPSHPPEWRDLSCCGIDQAIFFCLMNTHAFALTCAPGYVFADCCKELCLVDACSAPVAQSHPCIVSVAVHVT